MNKEKINELKKKLEESKESLRETLKKFADEDSQPKGDWDTRFPEFKGGIEESADEVEEYSSLLPVEHALELKLKNVDEAIEKIENNNYGKCEKCGEDILYKRLLLIPETKTCKDCK